MDKAFDDILRQRDTTAMRFTSPDMYASRRATWQLFIPQASSQDLIRKELSSSLAIPDNATMVEAQSMSKPVFAYRGLKLAEQGILNWMLRQHFSYWTISEHRDSD